MTKRIFYVDDDSLLLKSHCDVCEHEGVEITTFHYQKGYDEEIIKALKTGSFDYILIDYVLVSFNDMEFNGIRLLKRITKEVRGISGQLFLYSSLADTSEVIKQLNDEGLYEVVTTLMKSFDNFKKLLSDKVY